MDYGQLRLGPEYKGIDKTTGRFLPGHVPANKGKTWSQYLSKRAQRRCAKGWKNLDQHRNKNGRADNAGRCRKPVVAVMNDGRWLVFPYIGAAAEWLGGSRENIGRCCRLNQARKVGSRNWWRGHPKGDTYTNTDHQYKGVRFYFEADAQWIHKANT